MPAFTRKGDRKVGRPLSEDALYATEMGVPYRVIWLAGGAVKLRKLDDFTRNLLLKSTGSTEKRMRLRG